MAKHTKHKSGKADQEPKGNKKNKKKADKKSNKGKIKVSAVKEPRPAKISSEERLEMIRTAAYYLAQKRSHPGSSDLDDWIEAEQEIDAASNVNND